VVRFERRGDAGFITFDRPAARNAMTWTMYEQFAAALERVAAEARLRVVVLRGAAGSFVAGTDIAQFTDFTSTDDGLAYERRIDDVLADLETLPVPTLAVVEGYAAGAGLMLAAACDLRVCSPDARFGVPIARTVGNALSLANHARLVAQLGPSRVKALLFLADFLSADQALEAGFALEVVPHVALDARVDELCARIASHAPITLRVSKVAIRRVLTAELSDADDAIREAYRSRDFREGVAAFLAKRSPRWEDA
jgi:enoyl-CoA hydratase/carnithine racemase